MQPAVLLAAVLLAGSALLLPGLGTQSLWLDESLTVAPVLAAPHIRDVVPGVLAMDTQPPASHLLLWLTQRVLPPTEFYLRLPSFLAIEGGLALLWVALAGLWGPARALGVVAIAQVSPFLCFYAAEARNYGPWFLLVVGSFVAMARWYGAERAGQGRTPGWAWATVWALVNGLGLWVHLFHLFVIVGQLAIVGAVLLARPTALRSPWRAAASALGAQALAVALFVPWLLLLASRVGHSQVGVGWTRAFSPGSVAYYAFATMFGSSLGPDLRELHVKGVRQLVGDHGVALGAAAAAVAATLLVYAALVRDRVRDARRRWELLVLVVFPIAGLAGPLAYAAVASFPLHPRHLLFVWPVLPVVLMLGLCRGGWARAAVAGVLVLQLIALANLLFVSRYAKDDQRAAIAFAEQQAGPATYVLAEGGVARFYCRRAKGREKNFVDFEPGTRDVWLVDNRAWEPENARFRDRLERKLGDMRFVPDGVYDQFRGIVLRHWRAEAS